MAQLSGMTKPTMTLVKAEVSALTACRPSGDCSGLIDDLGGQTIDSDYTTNLCADALYMPTYVIHSSPVVHIIFKLFLKRYSNQIIGASM
jgi:hypothetical protein